MLFCVYACVCARLHALPICIVLCESADQMHCWFLGQHSELRTLRLQLFKHTQALKSFRVEALKCFLTPS